jgi:L-threonylcarbamoyladenylate synthase
MKIINTPAIRYDRRNRRMPKTLHLDARSPADIAHAASLLRAGLLVAFATETVYGLGANALSANAVASIFTAKNRPSWDPLIVHIASAEQLHIIANIPAPLRERILTLTDAFWPGPLTLLLPRTEDIPDAVTSGRELVGVRVPAHPAARALLAAAQLPIAAPSANLFGHTSPTTAEHVLADLDGRIDAVLDAGPTSVGIESTVLDPTQTPMVIYRPGAITLAQLTAATGIAVEIFIPADLAGPLQPAALPSPGVGIRHYAPRARLHLIDPLQPDPTRTLLDQVNSLQDAGENLGWMLPDGWAIPTAGTTFDWGPWENPATLAARLFAGLRTLDDRGVKTILCPLPPRGGLFDAIRDRLQKAART